MTIKRRTEITLEIERLVIFSRRQSTHEAAWCERCAVWVRMLTVDEAAALARSTPRAIYQRIEAEQIHFTETPDGRLLICLNSLP